MRDKIQNGKLVNCGEKCTNYPLKSEERRPVKAKKTKKEEEDGEKRKNHTNT
jgi:hypothetical protein